MVDKGAGLLTVPAHGDPCLLDALQRLLDRQSFGRHALLPVHRLDRETSGLLVFARSPAVAAGLAPQFSAHRVEREYVAVLAGELRDDAGTIRDRLDGKAAVTHFTVRTRRLGTTAVTIRLGTGRRNQIRRHGAGLGHPVVGDTRFAPELARHPDWPLPRLALHARVLGFRHPVLKQALRFEAPLPEAFAPFL